MFVHDNIAFEIRKLNLLIKREFDSFNNSHSKAPTKLQAAVVFFLHQKQAEGVDVYQKDLEEEFCIRASTVTALIKNMENAGLIARVSSSHDGRLKKIITTDKTNLIIQQLKARALAVREKLLRGLSEEELSNFVALIHKLQNNLEETK
ncbi:MAG: MarR family transcriptional regulator [Acetobacter sp.]|nr:MarR family transcriptional regulator [Acetobacter sp.]